MPNLGSKQPTICLTTPARKKNVNTWLTYRPTLSYIHHRRTMPHRFSMLGNSLRASRAVRACNVQSESHKKLWDCIARGTHEFQTSVQCCTRCIPPMVQMRKQRTSISSIADPLAYIDRSQHAPPRPLFLTRPSSRTWSWTLDAKDPA